MKSFPVKEYLDSIYAELLGIKPKNIVLSFDWSQSFDAVPGVYILRDKENIIYVGETGNLSGRMNDIRKTVNHTLRRSIGNAIFSDIQGWERATSKKRFIETIEDMINEHFEKNLTVAALEIRLGRCELEDRIIDIHKPEYNKKKGRKR